MRVAISQPEHFPYLGYFHKMNCCDIFVVLDHVQFSGAGSWQNRNRFTDKHGKQQWFTVPVAKNSYYERIDKVQTAPDFGWRKKLVRTMNQNFPGFDYEKIYSSQKLVDINLQAIDLCRSILGIKTPMIRSSTMPVDGKKTELIYNICKYLNADTYISGQGAKNYLDNVDFGDIEIEFIRPIISSTDSTIAFLDSKSKLNETLNLLDKFYV